MGSVKSSVSTASVKRPSASGPQIDIEFTEQNYYLVFRNWTYSQVGVTGDYGKTPGSRRLPYWWEHV